MPGCEAKLGPSFGHLSGLHLNATISDLPAPPVKKMFWGVYSPGDDDPFDSAMVDQRSTEIFVCPSKPDGDLGRNDGNGLDKVQGPNERFRSYKVPT